MNTMKQMVCTSMWSHSSSCRPCMLGRSSSADPWESNDMQCVIHCTCNAMSCSDISTYKCNAYTYCTVYVDENWSYRSTHRLVFFVVSTVVCKCIIVITVHILKWSLFAMCVPFPWCCYVYSLCLYLGLALYLLHCMHMCLWAAFQKCTHVM